jgi:hypothetical protein
MLACKNNILQLHTQSIWKTTNMQIIACFLSSPHFHNNFDIARASNFDRSDFITFELEEKSQIISKQIVFNIGRKKLTKKRLDLMGHLQTMSL